VWLIVATGSSVVVAQIRRKVNSPMMISERVRPHAADIVAEAADTVRLARLPHYLELEAHDLEARLHELLDAVLTSLETERPLHFAEHAYHVASDRFHAGVRIEEVQTAFNALEAALWRRIASVVPTERVVHDLGAVGAVLGAGKDQLASRYVELAGARHSHGVDVAHLVDAL